MASTSQIVIEVDNAGAIQSLQRVNAEAAKIGPGLAQGAPAMDKLTESTKKGREAAALLGEEFGVRVPRALRGVLAESTLLGPALKAAFGTVAVVGFIDVAVNAGETVAKFIDKLAGWSEQAKETMDAQTALNKVIIEGNDKVEQLDKTYRLIGLEGVAAFSEKQKIANEDLAEAKKRVSDLVAELSRLQKQAQETSSVGIGDPATGAIVGESLQPTSAALAAKGRLQETTNQLAEAQEHLKEIAAEARNTDKAFRAAFSKDHADEIERIGTSIQEAVAKIQAMTSEAQKGSAATPEDQINADLKAKLQALEDVLQKEGDEPAVVQAAAAASVAIEKEASVKRIKLLTEEADKRIKISDDVNDEEDKDNQAALEKRRRMEDETLNIERRAAVALAPPWERANVSIVASYQERMDKIQEMLNTRDLDEEHAARQQAAAWNEAFGQMRDQLASQMEGLFDDITSGNIGKRFKKMFEDVVFQMVATWVLGIRGMRAASAGAMGGGLGGLLASLFGFGGGGSGGSSSGVGPGGTPPFIGGVAGGTVGGQLLDPFSGGAANDFATSIPLLGLGLSAGQGSGTPGGVLPGGASAGGAASSAAGLAGVLTSVFPNGLKIGGATLSGSALATLSLGLGIFGENRILKGGVGNTLLGIGSDFLSGAGIGFAIGGPFGAGIGAAIGTLVGVVTAIFGGIFGQHKGDKARIEVMEPLMAQIKLVKDSYDVFQTDYNTGVSELEQLRSSSIASLKKIGGRQVKGNTASTNKLVDDAEGYLKTTEAERMRRAQLSFGPAQFHSGGFVDPSLASASPAYFRAGAMAFASGGEVPAILHAGEFVMRESAVQRVGRGNLQRMNSGGGSGDVHLHMNVNTIDAKSFSSFLKNGGGIEVILNGLWHARNIGMI